MQGYPYAWPNEDLLLTTITKGSCKTCGFFEDRLLPFVRVSHLGPFIAIVTTPTRQDYTTEVRGAILISLQCATPGQRKSESSWLLCGCEEHVMQVSWRWTVRCMLKCQNLSILGFSAAGSAIARWEAWMLCCAMLCRTHHLGALAAVQSRHELCPPRDYADQTAL